MANNYVDYKVEIWRRALFTEDADMKKISEIAKESIGEIFDENLGFMEDTFLYETEFHIPTDRNDGQSTIEVYQDDTNIWENS